MMEKEYLWSKVLLATVKVASSVSKHYDMVISGRAMRPTGIFQDCQSDYECAYAQAEKIINFIEEKKRAIEIFSICEEILNGVHLNFRKALFIKYKCKVSPEKVEKLLGCNIRTYFRHLKLGIKQFDQIRLSKGYTDEYLSEVFGNDGWIKSLIAIEEEASYLKSIKQNKEINDEIKENKMTTKINEVKKLICDKCKGNDVPCEAKECAVQVLGNKISRLEKPIGQEDSLLKVA